MSTFLSLLKTYGKCANPRRYFQMAAKRRICPTIWKRVKFFCFSCWNATALCPVLCPIRKRSKINAENMHASFIYCTYISLYSRFLINRSVLIVIFCLFEVTCGSRQFYVQSSGRNCSIIRSYNPLYRLFEVISNRNHQGNHHFSIQFENFSCVKTPPS